jgi:hypothetical protein
MTASQLALVCAGFSLNAMTFVLGVCVGVALHSRKDLRNDNSNEGTTKDSNYWHLPPNGNAPKCNGNGPCGRRQPKPEADPVERFAGKRRDHGE